MEPKTLLSVAIRTLAVWHMIDAFDDILGVISVHFGMFYPQRSTELGYVFAAAWKLIISLALLKYASLFSAYFYPALPKPKEEANNKI